PVAPLEPEKTSYTRRELAAALGIDPASVHPHVRRHNLSAEGNGKKRRYPRETAEALRERLARGASMQTTNYYLREIKALWTWLVNEDRLDRNPLVKLKPGNCDLDRRHERRELSASELAKILDAAYSSTKTAHGLAGADRHALYLTACATGFRAQELA